MSRTSNFDWSDSSLGVVQRFPSVDISAARPLPAPRPRERGQSPSARGCHTPNSFRPCRSSRLRRFSPRFALQVCCTLQPTMGFTTFPLTSLTHNTCPHGQASICQRTLPYPCIQLRIQAIASVIRLRPVYTSAQKHLTSELLRFL